jgi:hypothetical protein
MFELQLLALLLLCRESRLMMMMVSWKEEARMT